EANRTNGHTQTPGQSRTEYKTPGYEMFESASADNSSRYQESKDYSSTSHSPWRPGFWPRLPIIAILSLFFAMAAAVVMIVVVARSHGQIADWRVSPAVLLAISAAFANLLMRYALSEGVTLSWWSRSIRPGTKLEDLHNIWASGNYFFAALSSGRAFNLAALACIAVSLTPINGPLLQRASSVTTATRSSPVALKVPMAQEVPYGYTGMITSRSSSASILTADFTSVVFGFNKNIPQNLTESGCQGRCSGTLKAAGYAIACTSSTLSFNLSAAALSALASFNGSGNLVGPDLFTTKFALFEDYQHNATQLNFTASWKDVKGCAGNVQQRSCTLVPAVLEQHILLENNTISLDPGFNYTTDKVHSLVPTRPIFGSGARNSTHGGMALYLNSKFNSVVQTNRDGIYGLQLFPTGVSQMDYMRSSAGKYGDQDCNVTWADPSIDMLAAARELAFRLALKAADPTNSSSFQPLINGIQQQNVLVYQSKFLYLGLALLFTLASVLSILPTLYGWWQIGRKVSMSPLETAKAFGAPRLDGANSNAEVKSLLRAIGPMPVQYGAIGSKLVVGYPYEVVPPSVSQIVENELSIVILQFTAQRSKRVGLQAAKKGTASTPDKNYTFDLNIESLSFRSAESQSENRLGIKMSNIIMKPTNFFSLPRELRQMILVYSDNSSRLSMHPHRWWSTIETLLRIWEEKRIVSWANVLKKVDERMFEDVDYAAGRWTHNLEDWMSLMKSRN
ncbi:hypothetical protein BLS_009932, partial [Venturia inaequalis]